ncbi:MAG: hypothetical protein V1921_08990 [Candidatus Altiarchaeota archaeon]
MVSGQELGYIKPYQQSGILGTYAYLKWKRYGYPEGNMYPAPISEGITYPLPFGLANVYLTVKVNSIQANGVDMDVDTSQIIPTTIVSTTVRVTTTVAPTTSVRQTSSVQTTTVRSTSTVKVTTTLPSDAKFYEYDAVGYIHVSGQNVGYIQPYQKSGALGTYAYLKYKREGYPEGNTYPIPLKEGVTLLLPFGLANIYLKVEVYFVREDGVYMHVDTSQIIPTTTVTTSVPTTSTLPSDAKFYQYGVQGKIYISGLESGYVEPYQKTTALGISTYLKYRRYGFPEGTTYPLIPLSEGKTYPLPFGLENVYLRVTVYSIRDTGAYMTVNTSGILPIPSSTIPSVSTSIPTTTTIYIPSSARFLEYGTEDQIAVNGSVVGYLKPFTRDTSLGTFAYFKYKRNPAGELRYDLPVGLRVPIKLFYGSYTDYYYVLVYRIDENGLWADVSVEETVNGITKTVEDLNRLEDQLTSRIENFVNRGYYSSLHITGSDAQEIDPRVSFEMEKMELDIAENIGDTLTPLLANLFGQPELAASYCKLIKNVPAELRNDLTKYLLNIDTHNYTQHQSDAELSTLGAFTISVGGPSVNSLSVKINDDLRTLGLPHFERKSYGTVLVGDKEYTDSNVAVIAALPEEIIWKKDTIDERWQDGKIRFYRTMIAGLEGEGTETGIVWYTGQLRAVKGVLGVIKNSICFAGSADIPTEDSSEEEIFEFIDDASEFVQNESREFSTQISNTQMQSTKAILQGWYLAGMNLIQEGDYTSVPSAGYVVVIQKQGNSYKLLESYSIMGSDIERVM